MTLFHAQELNGIAYADAHHGAAPDVRSAAERLARAALEALAQATGVPRAQRRIVVERAPAAAATMAEAARRMSADVVVMAPHSRGPVAHVLGKSLTRATIGLLHDRVPVLCARGEAKPYYRILVPTDFTPRARRSFRLAARLASLYGAEVSVLHAVPTADDDEAARAALTRFLPRELARRAPRLMVEHGEPAAAIVSAAERIGADLVIVSTGGRHGLSDAVVGSTAERVIRHAPCPVLVS
jgi:nucleotide-binding universal stress UspA family protein